MRYIKYFKLFENVRFSYVDFTEEQKLQIQDILLPLTTEDFSIIISRPRHDNKRGGYGTSKCEYKIQIRLVDSPFTDDDSDNFQISDIKDDVDMLMNYLISIGYELGGVRVYSNDMDDPIELEMIEFDYPIYMINIDILKSRSSFANY